MSDVLSYSSEVVSQIWYIARDNLHSFPSLTVVPPAKCDRGVRHVEVCRTDVWSHRLVLPEFVVCTPASAVTRILESYK